MSGVGRKMEEQKGGEKGEGRGEGQGGRGR